MKLQDGQVRGALEEAGAEVLETMFFELPLEAPVDCEGPEQEALAATARFDGSMRGALEVALTGGCPRRLAAAFLGLEEEEVGGSEQRSMVAELANVLCGVTMSRLEPHGRLRIEQPAPGLGGGRGGRQWLAFPLENGAMVVRLSCEVAP